MPSLVKEYNSTDLGAPVLNGTVGNLVALLDAILVNGYGQVNVSSITRVGNLVTVVTVTAHGFKTGNVSSISGANETEYNGEFAVTVVNDTTFTYTVTGTPATPASGSIVSKRAPAGFSKVFTATNKGVYQSNDVTSTQKYLRVLDDGTATGGAKEAYIRGYHTMTNVDTGVDPFPSLSQSTSGYFAVKSNAADATARPWTMFTDGAIFYLWLFPTGLTGYVFSMSFGDIISFRTGDVSNCIITGSSTSINSTSPGSGLGRACVYATDLTAIGNAGVAGTIAKDASESSVSKPIGFVGSQVSSVAISDVIAITLPNPADNGIYIEPISVYQNPPRSIRGVLPGLYESLHGGATHGFGDRITNFVGLSGRTLQWMPVHSGTSLGGHFVDVTGPWR